MDGGITPVQVWAIGPRAANPQPATGQSLRSWLEESGWLPSEGSGAVIALEGTTEREVWLPAGRALEVSTTVQPGTPDVSRVVGYAIETPAGFAVLQIVGHPDFFQERGADLALLTQLVSFARVP